MEKRIWIFIFFYLAIQYHISNKFKKMIYVPKPLYMHTYNYFTIIAYKTELFWL